MFHHKKMFLDKKLLGAWRNEGGCNGQGDDPTCGSGTQVQKRTCTDGTVEKCTDADKQRTVTCAVAGTKLPDCSGKWTVLSRPQLGINVANIECDGQTVNKESSPVDQII